MNKKSEISVMNVIFCMIVIFIHVSSEPIGMLQKESLQYAVVFFPWRLSAFVVQGFIFLSGLKLFINKDKKTDYKKFYKSRLKKIFLPYIFAVMIFYIYFIHIGYFQFNFKDFILYCIKGNLVSHFYFVIIIMQFYLLLPLWKKIINGSSIMTLNILISAIAMIILGQHLPSIISLILPNTEFIYNDRVFTTYILYWLMGGFCGYYYDKFKEILKTKGLSIILLFFTFALIDGLLSYFAFTRGIYMGFLENIHILYSISAILFFCELGFFFSERYIDFTNSRFFTLIDSSTYYIYLIHPLIIFFVNLLFDKFSITSLSIRYIIRLFAVYIITVSICSLYTFLKNNIKKQNSMSLKL